MAHKKAAGSTRNGRESQSQTPGREKIWWSGSTGWQHSCSSAWHQISCRH